MAARYLKVYIYTSVCTSTNACTHTHFCFIIFRKRIFGYLLYIMYWYPFSLVSFINYSYPSLCKSILNQVHWSMSLLELLLSCFNLVSLVYKLNTGNCWIVWVWTEYWESSCLLWKIGWFLSKWRGDNYCEPMQTKSCSICCSVRTVRFCIFCILYQYYYIDDLYFFNLDSFFNWLELIVFFSWNNVSGIFFKFLFCPTYSQVSLGHWEFIGMAYYLNGILACFFPQFIICWLRYMEWTKVSPLLYLV